MMSVNVLKAWGAEVAEGGTARRLMLSLVVLLLLCSALDLVFDAFVPDVISAWVQLLVALGGVAYLASDLLRQLEQHKARSDVSLLDRIGYELDLWLSTNSSAKPMALMLATLLLIVVGGPLLAVAEPQSIFTAWWSAWTWISDPGTHADVDPGLPRLIAFALTVGGMLVFALLVGIISDEISERVDDLKKGRSSVIETGHSLILGWSDKTLPVIQELCLANESMGGGTIVVLSTRDKEEMEELIDDSDVDMKGSKVVCRTGSPLSYTALMKVSCTSARSIICLASKELSPDASDAQQLRIVLQLKQALEQYDLASPHVVVEVLDVDNADVIREADELRCVLVQSHDIIGRLMVTTTRQPLMGAIMAELLSFDGPEFYMREWEELVGRRFGEIVFMFDAAVPVGIRCGGAILLNPPDSRVIQSGEEIIVVAEDDDTYAPKAERQVHIDHRSFVPSARETVHRSRILFLNWRRDMEHLVMQLDEQVGPGTVLYMMSEKPREEQMFALREGGLTRERLQNITTIQHKEGNTLSRKHLQGLKLEEFDNILILSNESESKQEADSRSLATLLMVKSIQRERTAGYHGVVARKQPAIVGEILDPQTQQLVRAMSGSDYVMSNDIISSYIAQVSENRFLSAVLSELLTSVGCELYVRSAGRYLQHAHEELSFWDLQARTRLTQEILIGFVPVGSKDTVINPPKKDAMRMWSAEDRVIVLARD
ncbi:hypothetical protein PTSG_01334 [Salpingoeca rosetta]|uniref:RCK N-terminal domain-containing protein n=1 Tax=Salpingoeca rosetta (strain ATCC 50818 / BSB-021) TaxID=946362 RepID=F2U018_SALR5|nr:uncharacterized protein PTSG_01334 [Salpingoeca rosetta]EGD80746.1 hypothetical protein PTSG_01334 [Salpingoeca rosetta]|eukprot:XP_004997307.1 hypothetical protein PTSG_01334 [Salpingoeca rosetta]